MNCSSNGRASSSLTYRLKAPLPRGSQSGSQEGVGLDIHVFSYTRKLWYVKKLRYGVPTP